MVPMRQLIRAHCHRAAVRLATLHTSHPLYKTVHKAAKIYPKKHPSPIHNILHTSKIKPHSIEQIDFRPRHPCWKPPLTIEISPTRDEACQADRDSEADVRIYTDGSGKDEKIGASAILYYGFRTLRTARFHLGSRRKHTVFEGEAIGQLLGLKLLRNTNLNLNGVDVTLGVDSHAAIKRHKVRFKASADYIFKEIQRMASDLKARYPRMRLGVRWTPGHVGIDGNEVADVEAKKAAEGRANNTNCHFGILKHPLPISRSAHLQQLREEDLAQYRQGFQNGPRSHRTVVYDTSMPSSKYRKLTYTLHRRFVSLLTQLRTNHIPLQAYLHRFKLVDSPICQNCQSAPETVAHFLFFCTKYTAQRDTLHGHLNEGRYLDHSILGNKKLLPALFRFIRDTNRFEDTFGDLNLARNSQT